METTGDMKDFNELQKSLRSGAVVGASELKSSLKKPDEESKKEGADAKGISPTFDVVPSPD